MQRLLRHWACTAVLAALAATAAGADSGLSGREIYRQRCRVCHGTTAPADLPIGPTLSGVIGTKAGSQPSGVHSRAMIDSGIVWDRDTLRGFLAVPRREPRGGTIMPDGVDDPAELERLLDFLETLR